MYIINVFHSVNVASDTVTSTDSIQKFVKIIARISETRWKLPEDLFEAQEREESS